MFGHPKGLYVLFFTELWERFSYYGMRAILVLYMVAAVDKGGLGWSDEQALGLFGWYVMLVYVMSIPGGIIADRFIGPRKAVMLGGALLCAGHFLMAYKALWAFYSALMLIVLGVGLLKPNISTMVGGLYDTNDPRKDSAFTIFYMGINIGALMSGIAVGYLADAYGWHYGFALAGIGMLLGQLVYIWGQKHLKQSGNLIISKQNIKSNKEKTKLNQQEIRKLIVVGITFLVVIVFWAAFEQAAGLMSLYTERYTDRHLGGFEIPTAWFQSINPFFIIALAPVLAWIWIFLGKKNKEPSSVSKMGLGTIILGVGFIFMVCAVLQRGGVSDAKSGMHWLFLAYLFHTLGELALSPVSLSFITKMAPKRIASQVMGLYFAVTGLGGMLAARIGAFAGSYGELAIFSGIAFVTIFIGLLLVISNRWIKLITQEKVQEQSLQQQYSPQTPKYILTKEKLNIYDHQHKSSEEKRPFGQEEQP